MKQRIFGLENEYGLIFSPNGRIYLPMEKVLGYIFEGLIPNSWPSNAFLVNGARFYQDTGCHPEYSTPECDNILDLDPVWVGLGTEADFQGRLGLGASGIRRRRARRGGQQQGEQRGQRESSGHR